MDKRLTENVTESHTYIRMGKKSVKPEQNGLISVTKPPKGKFIHIRCSEEHYQMLQEAAKKAKFKLSTWVLHAAVNFGVSK